jgi:DNA-binding transcriptional regulator YhcF (GntR family)
MALPLADIDRDRRRHVQKPIKRRIAVSQTKHPIHCDELCSRALTASTDLSGIKTKGFHKEYLLNRLEHSSSLLMRRSWRQIQHGTICYATDRKFRICIRSFFQLLYLARAPGHEQHLQMKISLDKPLRDLPMTGEPLYERLAEHYRRVIASGTLVPGDRMPSVRVLMTRHQVSLSTALQVFRRLEDAGWLQAKPRSGYFVRRRSIPALPGVDEPACTSTPMAAQFVGLHESISKVIAQAQEFLEALNLGGATAAVVSPPLFA